MKYRSCKDIEKFSLRFNGCFGLDERNISFCCENMLDFPRVALGETAMESIESIQCLRADIIAESIRNSLRGESSGGMMTSGCEKCHKYQIEDYDISDGLIHNIDLGMYPAPCQSKCIYCTVHSRKKGIFIESVHGKYYEKVFEVINYAKKINLIASDAHWTVSSSEIAIHPYKVAILKLVEDQATLINTNCFLYDRQIAQILATNLNSKICLSIDSGTPETWFKIKGVNNFETVNNNLHKYSKSCIKSGQILLKYIVLPGINDSQEDYSSVIEIMKRLQVENLWISRDKRIKYIIGHEDSIALKEASVRLIAMLMKNMKKIFFPNYTLNQQRELIALAEKTLL